MRITYGTDQIMTLQFLIPCVTKDDKINRLEGKVYFSSPTYLTGRAKSKFTSMWNGNHAERIMCWSEAIHFFLRSYPILKVIYDLLDASHSVK